MINEIKLQINMGKALVIEGLTVSNPLCVVTFTVEVTSLTIDKSSLSMTTGDTSSITATVVTSDGTPLSPTFSSSDSTIASVSSSGNTATITAVARGNATITVRAGSQTVTCSVAVSAAPADEIAAYYTANQTIADADKTAMNALVTGMSNAGLWAKVKRFYPLLGTTLHDLLLEVKDNSGKGFNETTSWIQTNLQAQPNAVLGIAKTGNMGGTAAESVSIKTNNLAITTLVVLPSEPTASDAYTTRVEERSGLLNLTVDETSSLRRIFLNLPSTYQFFATSGSSLSNVTDRCIIASVGTETAELYVNGDTVISKSSTSVPSDTLKVAYTLFSGIGSYYKFLMITEALTSTEAATLNGLLETFFEATGKRSASS